MHGAKEAKSGGLSRVDNCVQLARALPPGRCVGFSFWEGGMRSPKAGKKTTRNAGDLDLGCK